MQTGEKCHMPPRVSTDDLRSAQREINAFSPEENGIFISLIWCVMKVSVPRENIPVIRNCTQFINASNIFSHANY